MRWEQLDIYSEWERQRYTVEGKDLPEDGIQGLEHLVFLKPTLHLHLNHPLVEGLNKLMKTDKETAKLLIEQVLQRWRSSSENR